MRIRCTACERPFDSLEAFDAHTCEPPLSPGESVTLLGSDDEADRHRAMQALDELLTPDGSEQ